MLDDLNRNMQNKGINIQQKIFVRSYKDNEQVEANEKDLEEVKRPTECLPFGVNIRKAALKSAFSQARILIKYCENSPKQQSTTKVTSDVDPFCGLDIIESEESDSVS